MPGEVDENTVVKTTEAAIGVAARCWCDPRVSDREMDVELGMVFAEVVTKYMHALQWCGGSGDFAPGGQAEIGWNKIVKPLLKGEV